MVAEHMMMQLLALAKRVREMMDVAQAAGNWGQKSRRCDEDTFACNWSQRQGIRGLWEATVGILGMGEIGLELARRLRGWECTVLYNKRRPMPALAEQELGVRFAPVDELLAHSDYVCVLLPFLPETEQSLDAGFLARMKPGACLVSCGGSGVVDEHALAAALRSGHLGGAALDTFTWEPIRPDNPLLSLALGTTSQQPQANGVGYNIILTPHTAAGSGAARDDARSDDYTNIRRVLNGQELIYRVA
jgi:phosphoglycerate dehydrogenase-like enzyme